jgi:hypothetical protein
VLKTLIRETLAFDWSRRHPAAALACLPAIAIPLAVGAMTGSPRQGMMAAAGAFSVGFGAFQKLRNSHLRPMLLGAVGMCVSSWIGTLAGFSDLATTIISAGWGLALGAAWAFGPATAWIVLQCLIWVVISTAYPNGGLRAFMRGAMVLAGGLLQIAIVSASERLFGRVLPALNPVAANRSGVRARQPQTGPRRCLPAIRAATVMAIAAITYRRLAIANAYWIPITAAIVMKPELGQTLQRGVARIAGTLVGAALATLIAATLRPAPWILAALVVTFAWASYLFIDVSYTAFVGCLTAYVVFLLAMVGLPENALIAHRALDTLVGGAIALLVHAALSPVEQLVAVRAGPPAP